MSSISQFCSTISQSQYLSRVSPSQKGAPKRLSKAARFLTGPTLWWRSIKAQVIMNIYSYPSRHNITGTFNCCTKIFFVHLPAVLAAIL